MAVAGTITAVWQPGDPTHGHGVGPRRSDIAHFGGER